MTKRERGGYCKGAKINVADFCEMKGRMRVAMRRKNYVKAKKKQPSEMLGYESFL